MIRYNALNVKLSNSKLNKLKSGMENGTERTLTLSSNVIIGSNEGTNFLHKLSLTDTLVSTQPARDVPETSTEVSIKVLTSGTFRGTSGDS